MKHEPGEGMAILGSASIVAQLSQERLIDEFQMVMDPIALGGGKTMFQGVASPVRLRLLNARTFKNGKVLLTYAPDA
jgi:dihydrofolate reductase